MSANYTLKDDVSEESRDLLKGMLEADPAKRLTVRQILSHPWLSDVGESSKFVENKSIVVVFSEQEKLLIAKEFTYNNTRRLNRNKDHNETEDIPSDCFTAQQLDSTQNPLLKNVSTRSVILAPFNSTKTHLTDRDFTVDEEVYPRGEVIIYEAKVREIDRQYERNNNCELDNGVYNKNNKEDEDPNAPKNKDDPD